MANRTYIFMTKEQEYDALLETHMSNERDHAIHVLNRDRFTMMLATLPEGPFRQRIVKLLEETASRILEVESILDATIPQLPKTQAERDAALARLKAKGSI